ncbi:MAG: hypothetical protein AB1411_03775 [Nitrospirota bacterium]
MTTGEALDLIGGLIASVKTFSAKLPAVVHLSVVPGGMKPTPEAVASYEQTLSRFRSQVGATPYRKLTDLLLESLEAFEAGKVLGAVQPLLAILDQLEQMRGDKEIAVTQKDEKQMQEYRAALHRILPGNKPELEEEAKRLKKP